MSGAVGMSMVGAFFIKLKGEPRVSIRKHCDIYIVCKTSSEKKIKHLTEIMADAGRNKALAETIKNYIENE